MKTFHVCNIYFGAGVVISLNLSSSEVIEGVNSSVQACAVLLNGTLERDISVRLSTVDGTATSTGVYQIFLSYSDQYSLVDRGWG